MKYVKYVMSKNRQANGDDWPATGGFVFPLPPWAGFFAFITRSVMATEAGTCGVRLARRSLLVDGSLNPSEEKGRMVQLNSLVGSFAGGVVGALGAIGEQDVAGVR